ncbi:MAG: hypothetical protein IAI50_10725 [Candidatus Eremiobacteraeota bacterium]|nr:hypothetical protein [Candidatus Eremiobacteraeota bacterium]
MPRHRTLRALIDWSHDLLNERERLVFRRLSIFANGFKLEAAVALLCEDLKEHEIFDGLASLVDKSLIVTDSGPDSVRYRLLESTRAYAAERLATAGDDEFAARLHRRYFRDLFAAKRAREDESVQSFRAESTSALLTELDNVRAALDSAVAPAEIVVAGDLLAQLTVSWAFIGLGREGEMRLEEILPKLPQNEPKLHVGVLSTLSLTLVITGRRLAYAFDLATLALAYARTSGDDRTLAWALAYFTSAAISNRRFEVAEKALAELAALPNKAVRLRLLFLGYRQLLAFMRGDFEGVVSAHALAIEESQSFGALEAVRDDTYHVAASELALGRSRRAIDLQREGVKRYRASGHPWLAHNLESLAVFLAWAGDLDEAAKAAREAIELLADKDLSDPAPDIDEHAFILALRGNYEGAALLEGSAEAALQRNANERNPFMALIHDRVMVLLRERLQAGELHDLASRGAALTWAETVSLLMDEYDSSC